MSQKKSNTLVVIVIIAAAVSVLLAECCVATLVVLARTKFHAADSDMVPDRDFKWKKGSDDTATPAAEKSPNSP